MLICLAHIFYLTTSNLKFSPRFQFFDTKCSWSPQESQAPEKHGKQEEEAKQPKFCKQAKQISIFKLYILIPNRKLNCQWCIICAFTSRTYRNLSPLTNNHPCVCFHISCYLFPSVSRDYCFGRKYHDRKIFTVRQFWSRMSQMNQLKEPAMQSAIRLSKY